MTETVHSDYEVKSESAICHWEIPYPRLTDQTPTPTNPARVTGLLAGAQLQGTILTISPGATAATSFAVIDFTPTMVYMHDVRTVLTYAGGADGAEATWGALNIGDPVYYDNSTTMLALGIYLSTAPANDTPGGVGPTANTLFGWIVPAPTTTVGAWDTDAATFPLAAGVAGNTHRVAVMQRGAGG
jgi:hypothetical protein